VQGEETKAQSGGRVPARAESLLRQLVGELGPAGRADADEVVLGVDVDGVRYTLTRRVAAAFAPSLSAREREVARMVAKGYTNKTIAAVLEISSWTVDTHIRRIFGKLGVRSRSAMVARLAAAGDVASADDGTPEWREAWSGASG
jgi:DNA-binding CsgD family transcriptional regulator